MISQFELLALLAAWRDDVWRDPIPVLVPGDVACAIIAGNVPPARNRSF
jgi:hypothetical protein